MFERLRDRLINIILLEGGNSSAEKTEKEAKHINSLLADMKSFFLTEAITTKSNENDKQANVGHTQYKK